MQQSLLDVLAGAGTAVFAALRCGACGSPIGLPGACRLTATGYPPGRSAPRTLLCRLDLPLLLETFNGWLTAAALRSESVLPSATGWGWSWVRL